jgi:hypothetical protein
MNIDNGVWGRLLNPVSGTCLGNVSSTGVTLHPEYCAAAEISSSATRLVVWRISTVEPIKCASYPAD